MKKIVLASFCSFILMAQEDLSILLDRYKEASDLSKITKQESAGFLDLYTREDLEKMQVHTLFDVLRTISGIYVTRGANNLTLLQKPSKTTMPLGAMRLYINDHDVSSTTFGSAFLIWGEMPIEYIDHIEVYKATSSIEFGNENAPLIIKLYTKEAARENGGNIRLSIDSRGSGIFQTYFGQELNKDFSYFAYLAGSGIKRKEYTNYYNTIPYNINSDRKDFNFYANFQYKKWQIEVGNYFKKQDDFLGRGIYKTPSNGDVDSNHTYIHLTTILPYNINLQLSYDNIEYEREYTDENKIQIYHNGVTDSSIYDYFIDFHDNIYSIMLEKEIKHKAHRFIVGGFYKYKTSKVSGKFQGDNVYTTHFDNGEHLSSLYVEENYNLNKDALLVASIKGDFYSFQKDIQSHQELIARIGGIANIKQFQMKLFYTSTYIPLGYYQLYNPTQTPYQTNTDLDFPQLDIIAASVRYKKDKHTLEFLYAYNNIQDAITYNTPNRVPQNISQSMHYHRTEIRYKYHYDCGNKFMVSLFNGENSSNTVYSPKYGINARLYNHYKQFDIYNELLYKDSYTSIYGNKIDQSFNYTLAVKYHYSKDLHFGIRAENIFDDGYKVDYKNAYPISVDDRVVWFEMGYLY